MDPRLPSPGRKVPIVALLTIVGLIAIGATETADARSPAATHEPDSRAVHPHRTYEDIDWVTPVPFIVGEEDPAATEQPKPKEHTIGLLWILINFAALMFILEKLLFSKLRTSTAAKHDAIKHELQRATAARTEAEVLIGDYRARMERLDDEIETLMQDARQRAEADRGRIIEAAKREAERIKAAAEAAVRREAEHRKRVLEAEIVDRAVTRAEAIVRERISPMIQERMVGEYVQGLGSIDISESSRTVGGAT
jgi:F-type H+-transporting ATPase subunit b